MGGRVFRHRTANPVTVVKIHPQPLNKLKHTMINLSKNKGKLFFLETQGGTENLITLKNSLENQKVTFVQCDMLDDIDIKILSKNLNNTMDTVIFDDFDKADKSIKDELTKFVFGMDLVSKVIVGKEDQFPKVLMDKMIKL